MGEFGEFTPGNEPGSELFAIERGAQQMPLEREMLQDRADAAVLSGALVTMPRCDIDATRATLFRPCPLNPSSGGVLRTPSERQSDASRKVCCLRLTGLQ